MKSCFFRIPLVVGVYIETDWQERAGPYLEWERHGRNFQAWIGRTFVCVSLGG
jgi:hypothetical protein